MRPVGPQDGGLHLGTKDYRSERALLTMKRSVLKAKAQEVAGASTPCAAFGDQPDRSTVITKIGDRPTSNGPIPASSSERIQVKRRACPTSR